MGVVPEAAQSIQEAVNRFIASGIAQPSMSAWASPIFTESWRIANSTVNFLTLNQLATIDTSRYEPVD
jgi:hypothetical protein